MPDEIRNRRATDKLGEEHVERRNSFLRLNARIAVWVAAVQLFVNVAGDIAGWFINFIRIWSGKPIVALPELPWGFWTSVGGFVVLTMIGYAFWTQQVGEPGRFIDLFAGMIPKKSDE